MRLSSFITTFASVSAIPSSPLRSRDCASSCASAYRSRAASLPRRVLDLNHGLPAQLDPMRYPIYSALSYRLHFTVFCCGCRLLLEYLGCDLTMRVQPRLERGSSSAAVGNAGRNGVANVAMCLGQLLAPSAACGKEPAHRVRQIIGFLHFKDRQHASRIRSCGLCHLFCQSKYPRLVRHQQEFKARLAPEPA